MQKSYLSAFYNDPKLNRYPQEKKIQPLFKKSFLAQEETFKKQLEESDISIKANTSGLLKVQPDSSVIKSRTRKALESNYENDLETKENLEFLINKLKSEKLEVFKELLGYEEKYQHKLCLRARLQELKQLCTDLLKMRKIALDRLNTENNLYGYLQMGFLSLTEDKISDEESSGEEVLEYSNFVQTLVEISGMLCVCLAKLSDSGNISLSIYPYYFSQAIGIDIDLVAKTETLEETLNKNVIPFLSFSFTDSLKLEICEFKKTIYKFLIKLPNIKKPQEILVVLKDKFVSIQLGNYKIDVTDICLFELLASDRKLEASNYISNNLSLLVLNQETNLEWKAKTWEIKKHSLQDFDGEYSLIDFESTSTKFENHYKILYEDYLQGYNILFQLYKNSVSDLYKIVFSKNGKCITIKEDNDQEDFKILCSLQNLDISNSHKTFINSLEFYIILKKYTNKIY